MINGVPWVPQIEFLTKGVGRHKERLTSYELALRDARIAQYNLVSVSSIFPAHCKLVSKSRGLPKLDHGEIVFCVMARQETNEAHRLVASSIGVAIPADRARFGYLSEHHANGETRLTSADYAEDLAATMLATTLGIEFDPDQAWDERKQVYKASGHIFTSRSVCQSAVGDRRGLWTSVIAAAVLLMD